MAAGEHAMPHPKLFTAYEDLCERDFAAKQLPTPLKGILATPSFTAEPGAEGEWLHQKGRVVVGSMCQQEQLVHRWYTWSSFARGTFC